ncbi:hypothetical protein LOC51_38230 [Rubrivivax sp. JA1024]|nr:hypothetical protein [Rubrivivax sp. JA1024]
MNAIISIIVERPASDHRATISLRAIAPGSTSARLSLPRSGLCCSCRMNLG